MIVLWGDDFSHMYDTSYDILDKIISTLNRNLEENGLSKNYQLSYSTMTKYFESVFKDGIQSKIDWKKEEGDFWAYNG